MFDEEWNELGDDSLCPHQSLLVSALHWVCKFSVKVQKLFQNRWRSSVEDLMQFVRWYIRAFQHFRSTLGNQGLQFRCFYLDICTFSSSIIVGKAESKCIWQKLFVIDLLKPTDDLFVTFGILKVRLCSSTNTLLPDPADKLATIKQQKKQRGQQEGRRL